MDALLFEAGISRLADTLRLLEIMEEVYGAAPDVIGHDLPDDLLKDLHAVIYPGSRQHRGLLAATHRALHRASQEGLAEIELLVGPRSMSIARSPVLMLDRRVGAELGNRLRKVIVITHFAS